MKNFHKFSSRWRLNQIFEYFAASVLSVFSQTNLFAENRGDIELCPKILSEKFTFIPHTSHSSLRLPTDGMAKIFHYNFFTTYPYATVLFESWVELHQTGTFEGRSTD